MRQLFFIPSQQFTFPKILGASFHVWKDDSGQSVGVVNMDGGCDSDAVLNALEATCECLPNHFGAETIGATCASSLAKYGVVQGDTTMQAIMKVNAAAGFPHLKPRKF